jgi:hypothetical protein
MKKIFYLIVHLFAIIRCVVQYFLIAILEDVELSGEGDDEEE